MSRQGTLATLGKVVFLGVIDSLAVWAAVSLALRASWVPLTILVAAALLLNGLALSRRTYPLRYLVPGLIFLFAMVVYPIIYTASVSLTNLQTGNLLAKPRVIALLEDRYYPLADSSTYSYQTFINDQGVLLFILHDDATGTLWVGDSKGAALSPLDRADPRYQWAEDGSVAAVEGFRKVETAERFQLLARIEKLAFAHQGRFLRLAGPAQFNEFGKQYRYDAAVDELTDLQTGKVYHPIDGQFTAEDGSVVKPGFPVWVGFRNYARILGNAAVREDFVRVFVWTILWSLFSVLFSFSVGLGLALLLNDRQLRLRFLYRTLLLVPYVMPVFISALVWRGMFDANFGVINRIVSSLFGTTVPWLTDPTWAKFTLVFINVWLSFPYMMIVCLGALQSIPGQLYEAARVDGAGALKRFSTITFPLLMVSTAPLLIGSFAFAFNNFTLIFLVTAGRPAVLGAATPAGATDILISWTYRIAFEGGVGNQLGLASAVSIIIFFLIAGISAVGFRFTRPLEEIYK